MAPRGADGTSSAANSTRVMRGRLHELIVEWMGQTTSLRTSCEPPRRAAKTLAALLLVAGCGFESNATGNDSIVDAPGGDPTGGEDAPAPPADSAPVSCVAWAAHFDVCALPAAPAAPLTLAGSTVWRFDTTGAGAFVGPAPAANTFTTKALPQTGGGPQVLVLYASAFTLQAGAILDVVGDTPLVVAADTTLEIAGTLNANSRTGASIRGPGANAGDCTSGIDGAGSGDGGGGGGAGLSGLGGGGGARNVRDGGLPGALVTLPATLRAGCGGGAGGRATGGRGGDGGGALELAARTSILVSGSINTGGGGGVGGGQAQQRGGGGGGGSGGVLSFDSTRVTLSNTATVAANGGGGGGGAEEANGGSNGADGALGTGGAVGGTSDCSNVGGGGGAGVLLPGRPGTGAENDCGGGGGGGAAGYVLVRATAFNGAGASISPPAIRLPETRGR